MSEERLETSKVSMAASKKDEDARDVRGTGASESRRMDEYPYGYKTITSYFAKALEEKDVPSLKDFIRLNIDFVAGSPPNTSDFSALSGAWTHRFLSSAKLLGIAKVVKDRPDWTPVIERRMRMQIASNRRKKTLLTYLKETEFIGNQLFEDQRMETVATQKSRDKEVDEDELSDSSDTKSDGGSLSPCETVVNAKRASARKQLNREPHNVQPKEMLVSDSDILEDNFDLVNDGMENESGYEEERDEEESENLTSRTAREDSSNPFLVSNTSIKADAVQVKMYLHLEDEHWQEINAKFKAMKKERMWKLSTGRYVEEEIYKLTKKFGHECALHSFIVDIDDMAIREHFSDTELDEIESAPTPPFPKLGDPVIECLNKFVGKTDLKAIREIIKETFQGKEYDVEKYHDIDYILFAVHALVREIESRKLDDTNLENWFNCHVWNVIVDQCFGDMVAVSIVRGESTSTAVASRKNEHRQMGEKRKIGRRGDWILRSTGNNDKCEYGAGEASRLWVDNYGTKFLREAGLKLPKMLSNMLRKLMQKANWDKESCKRMQTVGIVHSGLMMTMMYVDNPRGYIFRARRSELMEVPNVPEKFPVILIILAAVLNAKAVVCETIKALLPKEQMAISFSEAGLRKRTHEKMEPREQNEQLMACLSTPRKKRALQSK